MLKRRGKFAPSVGAVSRLQRPIVETLTNTSACTNVIDPVNSHYSNDSPEKSIPPEAAVNNSNAGDLPPKNDEPSLPPSESPPNPLSLDTSLQCNSSTLDKENLIENATREKNWDTQSKDASITALEEQHLAGLSTSHYKARKKVCPFIREGSHRIRTFSSASESEDDAGKIRARTPLSPVKKSSTVCTSSKSKDCIEISIPGGERNDMKTTRKKKKKEKTKLEIKKEIMRRKFASGEVDRKDWTMFDLIYINPKDAEELTRPKEKLVMRLKPYEVEELAMNNQLDGIEEVMNSNTLLDERVVEEEEMRRCEEAPSECKDALDYQPSNEDEHNNEQEENAMPAPQLRLAPDGVTLIVDERSLVIDTTETTKNKNQLANAPVVIENHPTLVNYGSWNKRKRSARWSREETARFHLALRMVGTDFSLMESIFPYRKRTELKRKFKSEEKCNPELIEKAISNQIPFDLEQLREEVTSSDNTKGSKIDTPSEMSRTGKKLTAIPIKMMTDESSLNDGGEGSRETNKTDPSKLGNKSGRKKGAKKSKDIDPTMGPPNKKTRTQTKSTKAKTTKTRLVSDGSSTSADENQTKSTTAKTKFVSDESSTSADENQTKSNKAKTTKMKFVSDESSTSADENQTLSSKAVKVSCRKVLSPSPSQRRHSKSKMVEDNIVSEVNQSLSEEPYHSAVEAVIAPKRIENICTPLGSLLQSPLGQLSLEEGGITVVENSSSEKQATSFLVPPAITEDPNNEMVHVYRISIPFEPIQT